MMRLDIARETRTCPKGHGEYESVCNDFGDDGGRIGGIRWTGCPECDRLRYQAERQAAEEVEKHRRWEAYIALLVKSTHIPPRFQGKGFDSYKVRCAGERAALSVARTYAETFKDQLAVGRCLVFCGKPGCGKTHLACAIADTVARAGHSVLYTTVPALILRIRDTWSESRETESAIQQELRGLKLLILDEVGLSRGGDAEISQLTDILNSRYEEIRPTLTISNYAFNELGKYLGARGVDRLRENGGKVVLFDWESRRGQNAN